MLRTTSCVNMLITLLTGLLYCPLASAQTVVIDDSDRGWYSETGLNDPAI